MDSYAPSIERRSRERCIEQLAPLLLKNQTASTFWRNYFVTFRFDRYRSHYLTSSARCGFQGYDEVRGLANSSCLYSILEPHPLEQFQPLNFAGSRLKMAFTCSM